jgi:hypothetical protein
VEKNVSFTHNSYRRDRIQGYYKFNDGSITESKFRKFYTHHAAEIVQNKRKNDVLSQKYKQLEGELAKLTDQRNKVHSNVSESTRIVNAINAGVFNAEDVTSNVDGIEEKKHIQLSMSFNTIKDALTS